MTTIDEAEAVPGGGAREEPPLIVVTPPGRGIDLGLPELWHFRELLYFLVWRNVKVRYKQTAVGALWAVLQPLLLTLLFSVVFGRLAHISSDGVPYPVFAYAGLLPWFLFVTSLNESSTSLVTDKDLVTKVYFPRLAVPLASVIAATVDFCVGLAGLVGLMAWYDIAPTATLLLLPLFTFLAIVTAFGVASWLSALNVQYRDVQYTIPFLTQAWLFATPIAYSASLIPPKYRWIYGINPMAGVVGGFRWCIFHRSGAPSALVGIGVAIVIVLLATGVVYFRRAERTFADII